MIKYVNGEYYEYCRRNGLMPTEEGYKIWFEGLDLLGNGGKQVTESPAIEGGVVMNEPKYTDSMKRAYYELIQYPPAQLKQSDLDFMGQMRKLLDEEAKQNDDQ